MQGLPPEREADVSQTVKWSSFRLWAVCYKVQLDYVFSIHSPFANIANVLLCMNGDLTSKMEYSLYSCYTYYSVEAFEVN